MPNPDPDPDSLADLEARGLATRRAVLGDAYVDRALAGADAFGAPLQQLLNTWCWGELWNRPGLARRERSLLNLAMLAVLNRPHELKTHVRGALTNGVTREEIAEVFLQVAVYAGVPAAVDAFRQAREAFAALDAEAAAAAHAPPPGAPGAESAPS